MKTMLFMAVLAFTGVSASAQNEETRNVKNFTNIEVQNGIEVIFTHSDTELVSVTSSEKDNLNYVVTKCKGKVLKVYINEEAENATSKVSEKIIVYISDNNTSAITASSGAVVKVSNQINVPQLTVILKTGATFSGKINTTEKCTIKAYSGSGFKGSIITGKLKTDITEGAYVQLNGHAEKASVFCSGGTLAADKFNCDNVEIWARRMSAIAINVEDSIKIDTDKTSAVTYFGHPDEIYFGDDTFALRKN
ncbi:hypothetical protein DVK85_00415 [Flavobacterium arcticum]|uniref:Putative auto-transporter adhesin head GIN domain-containing protein n=1 Tax=Flavobacterium arcticum TaxID=1784713 RepID=A0A345H867_9FLAO|nr:DUF2807 domain-containing protein [Flavobacterium arcticum]AXG72777.1 hypothetical protein DVK85_00415 [Flavobacterium arcticum]KAF2510953.1 hypothetical protein E0W72_06050 [Flavobacterium arcticum]